MIPDINLIPKLEKEQSVPTFVYLIVGAAVLLLLAFLVWQYIGATNTISILKTEESTLQQKRDQLATTLEELNTVNEGSIEDLVSYIDLISYPVLPLINEIEGLQPNNAHLREYSFGLEEINVSVDFETFNDASEYISRLTNSDYFVDVQVNEITQYDLESQTAAEGETTTFNVIPRHTTNLTLYIDSIYLATGGVR